MADKEKKKNRADEARLGDLWKKEKLIKQESRRGRSGKNEGKGKVSMFPSGAKSINIGSGHSSRAKGGRRGAGKT